MSRILFKFCCGDSAIRVLRGNAIFVTSPLDLNDPFEMRPAWTEEHEQRFFRDQQTRSNLTAGLPLMVAMKEGLKPAGVMPYIPPSNRVQLSRNAGRPTCTMLDHFVSCTPNFAFSAWLTICSTLQRGAGSRMFIRS